MGRRNKSYSKDLHQQAYERLVGMQAFGVSKKESVADGTAKDKIFSYGTYEAYWKHTKYFIKYIQEKHPECTTLKAAQKYMNEAKALGKLFGIDPDDENYFQPPKRERQEIVRSRVDRVRDKHFSKSNNDELIKFCKGTGLRRSELLDLKGKDLITRDEIEAEISQLEKLQEESHDPNRERRLDMLRDTRMFQGEYFTHVRNGKGGRVRMSPIIGPNAEQIIERMKNTAPDEKVWQHVSENADIHGYRAEYATEMYKAHARAIEDIPYDRVNKGTGKKFQGDVYVCRKDEAGRKLDKAAMMICSKALGHNRIEVVANNYIRGL